MDEEDRGLFGRRLFRNRRAVSTILATLFMVIIVVLATVVVYTWSTGLLGALLVPIKTGNENLTLEQSAFSANGTLVQLYLRNIGGTPVSLVTYYVRDLSNNLYGRITWSGPTITPNTVAVVSFGIGASCSGCSLTGSSFSFAQGSGYTITMTSSRNNAFSYIATWR